MLKYQDLFNCTEKTFKSCFHSNNYLVLVFEDCWSIVEGSYDYRDDDITIETPSEKFIKITDIYSDELINHGIYSNEEWQESVEKRNEEERKNILLRKEQTFEMLKKELGK